MVLTVTFLVDDQGCVPSIVPGFIRDLINATHKSRFGHPPPSSFTYV